MVFYLDNAAVASVLKPLALTDRLERSYRRFCQGGGVTPPRIDLQMPGLGQDKGYQLGLAVGVDGGDAADRSYACVRIKSDRIEPQAGSNGRRKTKWAGEPGKYLGLLLVLDPMDGRLLCVMQDGWLQRMRVGCDSALGVRLMARPEASVMGLFGAGGMAESHIRAISAERNLSEIRVFSPTEASRNDFAARMADLTGLNVIAVSSPEAAAEGADILCSCTNSRLPVVEEHYLAPGQHVTAIGGGLTDAASARIDRALRFGLATAPQGFADWDFTGESLVFSASGQPLAFGTAAHFANLMPGVESLLRPDTGPEAQRKTAEEITFSQRGNIHGIQFAAGAGYIYEAAIAAGLDRDAGLRDDGFLQNLRN